MAEVKLDDINLVLEQIEREIATISWHEKALGQEISNETKRLLLYSEDHAFRAIALDLEMLCRKLPRLKEILKSILFLESEDILERAEAVPTLVAERNPDELLKKYLAD